MAITDDDLALEDRWVLSRLVSGVADCNANMQKRRLNDAAYDVFQFLPPRVLRLVPGSHQAASARRPAERAGPLHGGARPGRQLQAAAPGHAVHHRGALELAAAVPGLPDGLVVPRVHGEAPFVAERRLFEEVMEIVTVIRNVRAELGVPPGKRGGAILRVSEPEAVAPLAACADLISLLAKLETTEVVCGGDDPTPAGLGVAGNVEVFLPMKGLVDLDKERARLQKDLDKVEGWIKGCRAKLGNAKFTDNAPEHVVQQQRDLLAENEAKADKLRERLGCPGRLTAAGRAFGWRMMMTPKPQLVTPGEMLAAARKEAGLSLIELEARTKVPRQTLAAIEQDEYHKVSGELYVKSFLRAYAGEVGLDPAEVLQLYGQFSGASGGGGSAGEADVWTEEVRITRIGVPWGRVAAVIVAAAVVVALAVMLWPDGQGEMMPTERTRGQPRGDRAGRGRTAGR